MTMLTLITSVLNGRPYIEEMLDSVPADADVEHLVIDAGSTDGTLEILQGKSGLRLILRHGLPLYDAWNEALAAAQGKYILFLNADDLLAPGAIGRILPQIKQPLDILCAEADAFQGQDRATPLYHYRGAELTGLNWATLIFGAPVINAKIFRRALLREMGGFDASLPIAADRDLLLRLAAISARLRIDYSPAPLYRYRIHAGSKTLQQTAKARANIAKEHRRIAEGMMANAKLAENVRTMAAYWAAHETAVLAVRSLQAGDGRGCLAAMLSLCRGGFGSLAHLAAARKIRQVYAGRLRDAAAELRMTPSSAEMRA